MASGRSGGCNFGFELDSSWVVLFWKGEHMHSVLLYIWFQSSLGRKSKHSCSTLFCCLLRSLGNCRLWDEVQTRKKRSFGWTQNVNKTDRCTCAIFHPLKTLKIATQLFCMTVRLVMMYHYTMFGCKWWKVQRVSGQSFNTWTLRQMQRHDNSNIPT